ncbi:MAG: hypothetical protein PHO32_03830 [Candidatus Cloacimonetes bacterium]|nr:hypothetical protein [Candidatus Cloacimonadota bacterium]
MKLHKIHILLSGLILLSAGSVEARKQSFTVFPFIAYSNETKLLGGGFVNYYNQTERDSLNNQLLVSTLAIYTANQQFQMISTPRYKIKDGKHILGLDIRGKNYPDKYYGIGNSSDEDVYEKFSQKKLKFGLSADTRIWKAFYAGVSSAVTQESVQKREANLLPVTGGYHGMQGTDNYYNWGTQLSVRTTDDDFYPKKGLYYKADFKQYYQLNKATPKHSFGGLDLEMKNYFTPSQGIVLAMQSTFKRIYPKSGIYSSSSGEPLEANSVPSDVPFTFYPELGGELRVYDSKRFVDKVLIAERAELRFTPAELDFALKYGLWQTGFLQRVGFVVFSEVGQVAADESELKFKRNHFSNGFGFRYGISRSPRLNIRMDIAFGGKTMNVIIQGSEAF